MSFFDNTKTVGWVLFIIGILSLIQAVVKIAEGATKTGDLVDNIGYVIAGIGLLIGAFIFFKFGNSVRVGSVSSKLAIVAGFVKTVGVVTVIAGIFEIVGGVVIFSSDWSVLGDGIVDLILGAIVVYCGSKIDDGKNTGFDKILWIILVVLFFLLMLGSLLGIGADGIGALGIIKAICEFIMYLFVLVFMFDKEIKSAML